MFFDCSRGHLASQGAACAALAGTHRELGDSELALQYLEKFLDIAERNNQAPAQADACSALGSICSEMGEHGKAVEYFERTYELARSIGDRRLVDSARINLGMARGNQSMPNYMGVVTSDLPKLLRWKTQRLNFNDGP